MTTEVCANVRLTAFHSWPDAPAEVSYLRNIHRHQLVVRGWAEVTHHDRQIEFHMLARKLRRAILAKYGIDLNDETHLGIDGCEHVANNLLQALPELTRVEVWEDDEMGASVSR